MPQLKLLIPDGEDETLSIDTIPVVLAYADFSLSVIELSGAFSSAFEFGALGVAGFGVSIGGAVVGQWASLGSGYAEAWAKIKADRMAMGFSYGVVMGSDGRSGRRTVRYFGERKPEHYNDERSGIVAQKAFNEGLKNGYIQGLELSQAQKGLLWRDLVTRTGKKGIITREQTDSWGDGQWKSWYQEMGIAFRRFHIQR